MEDAADSGRFAIPHYNWDMANHNIKRWRPWRFSLQSLLLFPVVVGLAIGWRIDRNHLSELRLQIKDECGRREKAEVDVEMLRGQLNDVYLRVDESTQEEMRVRWRQYFMDNR